MNTREVYMLEILKRLKNDHGVVAVKAEFEAEGTRVDELLRLLELTFRADLKLALKIGGCEAVRDLLESKSFGCDYIIAPMIESAYGLSKFIAARDKVYGDDSDTGTEFLFNMETISCFENRDEVLDLAQGNIEGCVFGRVDFVGSKNLSRDAISSDETTNDVLKAAEGCKRRGLDLVVGGGVSIDTISSLRAMKETHLTRFETRKIVFSAASLDSDAIERGLLSAVDFELNWLKNKREFYETIFKEDETRIEMLESRWKSLIEKT